jgi:hypothetical protein
MTVNPAVFHYGQSPHRDNIIPVFTLNSLSPLPYLYSRSYSLTMKYLLLAAIILLLACHSSQKVYTAPAVGAEAQFDRGLRPEKHPQYLFDKKTMKDMKSQGSVSSYSSKRRNTKPTIPLPGKEGHGKDSTTARADSLGIPADSLHIPVDSTKTPVTPPDTTHIPF